MYFCINVVESVEYDYNYEVTKANKIRMQSISQRLYLELLRADTNAYIKLKHLINQVNKLDLFE